MSHCYHLLYSLQYNIDGLCDAAGEGRLEDVKEHVQFGVNIDGRDEVINYINLYMSGMHFCYKIYVLVVNNCNGMCVARGNYMFSVNL